MNKIERSEVACGGGEKTGEKGKEKKKRKGKNVQMEKMKGEEKIK